MVLLGAADCDADAEAAGSSAFGSAADVVAWLDVSAVLGSSFGVAVVASPIAGSSAGACSAVAHPATAVATTMPIAAVVSPPLSPAGSSFMMAKEYLQR